MLTGQAVSESPEGILPLQISYEDESGAVFSQARNINLSVEEAMAEDFGPMPEEEPEQTGIPVWLKILIGAGIGVVLLIVLIVIIRSIRKKKKKQAEDELASELLDESEEEIPEAVEGKDLSGKDDTADDPDEDDESGD